MKNITLSADENLIEAARRRAAAEHTTLNERFRVWLDNYVRSEQQAAEYVGGERQAARAMRTLRELQCKLRVGRKLTREEMNER